MECPNCQGQLSAITYEGIQVESCPSCGGEWLEGDELGKIVRLRQQRFSKQEQQAIANAEPVTGIKLADADRDLTCPKCGGTTDALHYAMDTGIIIDRCTACHGLWLGGGELEKVQMLMEAWEARLPEDLAKLRPRMREIAAEVEAADDVQVSRLPFVGRYINLFINGVLDIMP